MNELKSNLKAAVIGLCISGAIWLSMGLEIMVDCALTVFIVSLSLLIVKSIAQATKGVTKND